MPGLVDMKTLTDPKIPKRTITLLRAAARLKMSTSGGPPRLNQLLTEAINGAWREGLIARCFSIQIELIANGCPGPWVIEASAVMMAESGGRRTKVSPPNKKDGSVDRGRYQHNSLTTPADVDPFGPSAAIHAITLMHTQDKAGRPPLWDWYAYRDGAHKYTEDGNPTWLDLATEAAAWHDKADRVYVGLV